MEDQKILIIAGMHRSGTSLISHWLHRCGLHLGETLVGGSVGNVEGHFEDIDFLRFHEDILADRHFPSNGFVHEPVTDLSWYHKQKLQAILNFKSAIHQQWGWKEPRTCLFLDHYRELVPDAHYLIIIRDYKTTVSSLIKRDFNVQEAKYRSRNWFSRNIWTLIRRRRKQKKLYLTQSEFYLNVWITYNEALLKNMKCLPRTRFIVTDPNLLCETGSFVFKRLVSQWNFSLRHIDFNDIYKQNLVSEIIDIEHFISDKTLLKKAATLEAAIRMYL